MGEFGSKIAPEGAAVDRSVSFAEKAMGPAKPPEAAPPAVALSHGSVDPANADAFETSNSINQAWIDSQLKKQSGKSNLEKYTSESDPEYSVGPASNQLGKSDTTKNLSVDESGAFQQQIFSKATKLEDKLSAINDLLSHNWDKLNLSQKNEKIAVALQQLNVSRTPLDKIKSLLVRVLTLGFGKSSGFKAYEATYKIYSEKAAAAKIEKAAAAKIEKAAAAKIEKPLSKTDGSEAAKFKRGKTGILNNLDNQKDNEALAKAINEYAADQNVNAKDVVDKHINLESTSAGDKEILKRLLDRIKDNAFENLQLMNNVNKALKTGDLFGNVPAAAISAITRLGVNDPVAYEKLIEFIKNTEGVTKEDVDTSISKGNSNTKAAGSLKEIVKKIALVRSIQKDLQATGSSIVFSPKDVEDMKDLKYMSEEAYAALLNFLKYPTAKAREATNVTGILPRAKGTIDQILVNNDFQKQDKQELFGSDSIPKEVVGLSSEHPAAYQALLEFVKDPNEVTQKMLQAELGTAFKPATTSAQQIIEAGKQKKYFEDLIGKIPLPPFSKGD